MEINKEEINHKLGRQLFCLVVGNITFRVVTSLLLYTFTGLDTKLRLSNPTVTCFACYVLHSICLFLGDYVCAGNRASWSGGIGISAEVPAITS